MEKLTQELEAHKKKMVALVKEEQALVKERQVPDLHLEGVRLLANPTELLGMAEGLARQSQLLLGKFRKSVQALLVEAGPEVWDFDEAEEDGWMEGVKGYGRPSSQGDGLKMLVTRVEEVHVELAKVGGNNLDQNKNPSDPKPWVGIPPEESDQGGGDPSGACRGRKQLY